MPGSPDRYEPLPGLLEIPGWLLRKLPPARRRMVLIGVSVLLLALVVGAALGLPAIRAHQREQDSLAARRDAAARHALLARYAHDALPRRGSGPAAHGLRDGRALDARRTLVADLERAVLVDARARAQRSHSRLHYRSVFCSEYPKQVDARPPQDDVRRSAAVMECIAASAQVQPGAATTGSLIGQPFRALVDFDSGSYAWCKIVQVPGELSLQRERVLKIPVACGGDQ